MKRLVGLLTVILLLAGMAASAEQSYSLHNGTMFGMSTTEVIRLETLGGFTLESKNAGTILEGTGTIANQKDSTISYCFADDKMYEMNYKFTKTEVSFRGIENVLIEKYGETDYSSDTGYCYVQTVRQVMAGHPNLPTSNVERMPLYSQRIILLPDGSEMLIDHFLNDYGHVLIYTILTPEQAQIMKNTAATTDDL